MGSGKWSTNVYDEHARFIAASGKGAFDYSDSMHRAGRSTWRVHDTLNPWKVKARESRDSDEHPDSTAIAVMFDVTGSMGSIPVTLQKKLPELLGLLLRKGYVPDPQILFGAIGDATCDRVPLQVGQFESDNRMDDNLENIFLEGGGGGQRTESYELAMYFIARHTDIDCWNKHGRKGYLFIIGDEMAYAAGQPARGQSGHRRRAASRTSPPRRSSRSCANATTCSTSCRREPATAATRPSWASGANCSGRTCSSWRTRRRSARPSRSPSG